MSSNFPLIFTSSVLWYFFLVFYTSRRCTFQLLKRHLIGIQSNQVKRAFKQTTKCWLSLTSFILPVPQSRTTYPNILTYKSYAEEASLRFRINTSVSIWNTFLYINIIQFFLSHATTHPITFPVQSAKNFLPASTSEWFCQTCEGQNRHLKVILT